MMRKPQKVHSLCLLAAALATFLPFQQSHAQVLYGSLVGTVTDQSGAVVPSAHITVTNPQTGLKRETDTGAGGSFIVPNLPEGSYDLQVTIKGFKELKRSGILVRVGTVVRQDVQLEVGAMTQEVTVQASAVTLQTEKADTSTKLGTVAVENLPTGFYRNFQMLIQLAPGAGQPCEGCTGSIVDTPERAVSISVNGLPYAGNTTSVDGAQSTFLWKPEGGTLYVPPIESIQEVNVATGSYDPEKGMAGAAAVDVVTKSGTNELHGVLFWYHFDQHLLSCEPFDLACKAPGARKPKQILNDLGGNIGGPIKKDKLFFFANWDGVFQRNNFSRYLTVPPSAQYNGDFSSVLKDKIANADGTPAMVPMTDGHGSITGTTQLQQGMIFDPSTGSADGTGRAVFAANGVLNTIPQDRMWPGVVDFLKNAPQANLPGILDDYYGVTKNYFLSENQKFKRNSLDFKVDWNRSEKHLVWWKYSQMDAITSAACGFNSDVGGPCAESWGDSGYHHDLVQVVTMGHTWSVTPNFVLDGNVGYSRMGIQGHPGDFGKNVGLDVLKIPGTNDPNDPRYSGIPFIEIGGYGDPYWSGESYLFGSPTTWNPYFRDDWSLTNRHNATYTHGKHTFRFGADIVHHHLNHWQPENGAGPRGGFSFYYSSTTFLNTTNLNLKTEPFTIRENGFAAFLMGMYDRGGRAIQYQRMNGKEWEYGFHVLDRWRALPKLTVNLGLRYELYPMMSRDSLGKGIEQYDPNTNMMLLGGLGGNPTHLGVTTSKKYFAPRIGLAYQFTPNTVARAGYGITFDPYPILRELRGTYPDVISSNEWSDNGFQPAGTFQGGIPNRCCPDVSQGRIPIPTDVEARFVAPGELKRGIIQTYNVTVERKLPQNLLLSVGWVGNHAYNMWEGIDLNAGTLCTPNPGVTADGSSYDAVCNDPPLHAKWGRSTAAATTQLQGYLYSHYNSMQVALDRHFEKGLYLKFAYTYAKAIDMKELWGAWGAPMFAGPGYLQHNRGMGDEDRRQIIRLAYVWDLPFGKGRKWAKDTPVLSQVVGGWQLNGIVGKWSGIPLTLGGPINRLNAPGNGQTVDQLAPIRKLGQVSDNFASDSRHYYDPASFGIPPNEDVLLVDGSVSRGQVRFGTTGRNIAVYGPGHGNLDASLFRHFKFRERYDLQFRAESLNITNSPTLNDPNTSCSQVGSGDTVGSEGVCGGNFMKIIGAYGHRIFRLGLRLQF